jgi:hypothetical protein
MLPKILFGMENESAIDLTKLDLIVYILIGVGTFGGWIFGLIKNFNVDNLFIALYEFPNWLEKLGDKLKKLDKNDIGLDDKMGNLCIEYADWIRHWYIKITDEDYNWQTLRASIEKLLEFVKNLDKDHKGIDDEFVALVQYGFKIYDKFKKIIKDKKRL